jgi:hypothetical protein
LSRGAATLNDAAAGIWGPSGLPPDGRDQRRISYTAFEIWMSWTGTVNLPSTKRVQPVVAASGLVGHDHTPHGEEVFDISEAQTESVVEPDGVADDLGREPVSVVARCFGVHRLGLPISTST